MSNKWHFSNNKPIYSQIVEQVKEMIVSGVFSPGDQIGTVREIADAASVNPNTVQRAFAELEQTGLVHAQKTNGRFVTEDWELIAAVRKEKTDEIVNRFLNEMKYLGYPKEQIIEILNKY